MPKAHELKSYANFTPQEAAAVDFYTDPSNEETYRNKVRSYEAAGYYMARVPEGKEDDGRASRNNRTKAYKLFKKPHMEAEVERRSRKELKALEMSIDEAVARVSKMARVDLMEYLEEVPTVCPHCEGDIKHGVEYVFNVKKMKADGYGYLLQGITPTKWGTKFIFYPADQMLDRLMRYHGGFKKEARTEINFIDKMVKLAQGS